MHSRTLTAAVVPALLLLSAGCAPSDPSHPGPFAGANGAAAASDITRSASAYSGEQLATGASVNAAARATIVILARHEATVEQKRVVVQRARAAVVKLQQRAAKAEPASGGKKQHATVQKLPRYIAVDTVKDKNTSPKAAKAVMIWDTQAQDVVGNTVYDVASTPPVGTSSKFETWSAEYVGASL